MEAARASGAGEADADRPPVEAAVEVLDVLIVGAGISGIGCAYYLQRDQPAKTYAIVEARGAIGGTWDLFRYPGIRSDSDLYTFGYEFHPWTDAHPIASADKILGYLHEVIDTYGLEEKIRFHRRVVSAAFDSHKAWWTVEIEDVDTKGRSTICARWLFCAAGYYRYDRGHTPDIPGLQRFQGPTVHPQLWPDDLDTRGKRVVVIGSGATAVTLVPALADTAAHVTMLQRTPTYVMPLPATDNFAVWLRTWMSDERAHRIVRSLSIFRQRLFYVLCQRFPRVARRLIRSLNKKLLPEGFPVDEHFNPPYDPWDQRLCVVPDGDLFTAIRRGQASVVTDHIDTVTEDGVLLKSGKKLEADVLITATGLSLLAFGGMQLSVDGAPLSLPDKVVFKGMMLSEVPNFAIAIGYTNASWTLKIGLLCEHFCRLLDYMDQQGFSRCQPVADPGMGRKPVLDFDAGYVKRALHLLPQQGARAPWTTTMNYYEDARLLRKAPVADPELEFA